MKATALWIAIPGSIVVVLGALVVPFLIHLPVAWSGNDWANYGQWLNGILTPLAVIWAIGAFFQQRKNNALAFQAAAIAQHGLAIDLLEQAAIDALKAGNVVPNERSPLYQMNGLLDDKWIVYGMSDRTALSKFEPLLEWAIQTMSEAKAERFMLPILPEMRDKLRRFRSTAVT